MTSDEYLLYNRAAATEHRFAGLSAVFDDVTFRHIEALGIRRGWRCWEVGAGGLSVPNWLAGRVGPDGHVLASYSPTSTSNRAAPEGPMPFRWVSVLPVVLSSSRSCLSAAFLRW